MTDDSADRKPRSIRSFVRRSGRLTPAQARAIEALWPRYGSEFTGSVLDLDALFGRAAERVLEIGFGDGETLVQQAASDPARDYLGIEVHEPGIGHCLLRAQEEGLTNLRVIAADAAEVLRDGLPEAALSRINLYFPDPWPKKRHHKRRLLQAPFVELLASRLAPGGRLNVATDWQEYAEHIDEVMRKSESFVLRERRDHAGDQPLERPTTKFERRGLRKGHRIRDWSFRRA